MPSKIANKRISKLQEKIVKAGIRGKSKKVKRLSKRKNKIVSSGKTGVGRTVKKVQDTVNKVKDSKVGRVAQGLYGTYRNVRKGNISGAIKEGKKVVETIKEKKAKMSMKKPVMLNAIQKPKMYYKK